MPHDYNAIQESLDDAARIAYLERALEAKEAEVRGLRGALENAAAKAALGARMTTESAGVSGGFKVIADYCRAALSGDTGAQEKQR